MVRRPVMDASSHSDEEQNSEPLLDPVEESARATVELALAPIFGVPAADVRGRLAEPDGVAVVPSLDVEGARQMVDFMNSDVPGVASHALVATQFLSKRKGNRSPLAAAQVCPALVRMLGSGRDAPHAAAALGFMADNDRGLEEVLKANAVDGLVGLLDYVEQPSGTRIVLSPVARALIGDLSTEGLACLEHTSELNPVALERLVSLLVLRPDTSVASPAARAFWRIAVSSAFSQSVIDAGVLPLLVAIVEDAARTVWAPDAVVHAQFPQPTRDAICAVLALNGEDKSGQLRYPTCELSRLPLELLCSVFEYVSAPKPCAGLCLLLLGKLARRHSEQVMNAGALPPMVALLRNSSRKMKQQVCEALSDLSLQNCPAVVDAGAVPRVVRIFRSAVDRATLKAAAALVTISQQRCGQSAITSTAMAEALVSVMQRVAAGSKLEFPILQLLRSLARSAVGRKHLLTAGVTAPLAEFACSTELRMAKRRVLRLLDMA